MTKGASKPRILFLCPLGQQQRAWRYDARPADTTVIMLRTGEASRAQVLDEIAQADALITERAGIVDREMIRAGSKLKIIQRMGSLAHDIDLAAGRDHGVPICLKPMVGVLAVAEHVMMQMLVLLRAALPLQRTLLQPPEQFGKEARRTTEDVFSFNWTQTSRVGLIYGKTVGILGFGEIGTELSRLLSTWRCRVLYSKRTQLPQSVERELGIAYRSPEAVLEESDIVVSLMPYAPELDLWLNVARIATMKRGALLCHAGSGSVIDEAAVAAAVTDGQLAGCSFDTYEWEPMTRSNPLLQLSIERPDLNIFLTPHIGSCNDVRSTMQAVFYSNVMNALSGRPIEGALIEIHK